MKKWKNYLLSILAVAGFVACSDDDTGMPPVVDGNDVSIEIKRDTADVYKISLPITSEEGLSKVSLIDNATNKAIDEQTSFSNPNNHTYTYDFDLTPYTDNTVVMLTLKIEDKAGQIVNKKITLTVKKFSELDVRFAAEGTMSTWFENCNVKLTVVRGLIPLKELQVYVGETLSSTYDLSLDAEQSKYDLNVHVEGLQNGDNTVKVVVIDNKDQKFEKSITIKKTAMKNWEDIYRIKFNAGAAIEFNGLDMNGDGGDYPEDGRMYRIGMMGASGMDFESVDFEYGNNGMVSTMSYHKWGIDMIIYDMVHTVVVYSYTYDDSDEVTKVTRKDEDGIISDYITDIVYESGSIISYKIDGREYTPKYMEKDGEMIRCDYLDVALSGYTCDFSEKKGNPLYNDKLPILVPVKIGEIELNQYFTNPYFFESIKDGETVIQSYEIENAVYDEDLEMDIQNIKWTDDEGERYLMIAYN